MQKQSEKISVVVPNWNYSMFIRECVDSLLRQTVRPAKIIIADDASTDNSREIIEAYHTLYPDLIVPVYQEFNVGTIINENNAAKQVSTPWMFFLDADDYIDDRYIEKCERIIDEKKDDKLFVIYADMKKFGKWEGDWHVQDWDPIGLRTGNYINGHSVFRKDLFDEVGGLKNNGTFEDHQLWVDILDLDRGYYGHHIPELLIWYRRHDFGHRTDCTDKQIRGNM